MRVKDDRPGGTLNVNVSSNFGLSSPVRILVRCLVLRVGSSMSLTCECCAPPRSLVGISRASCTVTDIRPTSLAEREPPTTARYPSISAYIAQHGGVAATVASCRGNMLYFGVVASFSKSK